MKLYNMTNSPNLIVGQEVKVDGTEGIVTAIYPNGSGNYIGAMHAYIWVSTPSLNYTEIICRRGKTSMRSTKNGRAVPFSEITRRISIDS